MKRARDVMDSSPCTVSPDLGVRDLARRLIDARADGACVLEGDLLVGVVTAMDLIFQEQPVHLPSFLMFFDAVIPLDRPAHLKHDLEKTLGLKVRDIMSTEVISASPDERLEDVATRMVKKHTGYIPVVEEGRLLGVVTKPAVLRAAFAIDER